MTWLLIAITAQIVLGTSVVFDKLLLKRGFVDPWVYAFWFGLLGIFSFLLLPFGVANIPLAVIPAALVGGAFFIAAMLCVFLAIRKADVAGTLALVGALSPIATLTVGSLLKKQFLGFGDLVAFGILIFGGFLFFVTEKKELRVTVFLLSLGGAVCFGISNVLTKITFEASDFLAGFFWPRMGGILFALALLLIPRIRQRIFMLSETASTTNRGWYFANRVYGSLGSFLVSGAIFLAHPALVDATQSMRHVVIFLAGWFLLKERARGLRVIGKMSATTCIAIGLIVLGLVTYAAALPVDPHRDITWGITFSDKYSRDKLGLDWQANFNAIIDELRPKKMRLIAYWDEIEKEHGTFDFSILDWQMDRIAERGIGVVIVVGMKEPRWPECHIPAWAASANEAVREEALREYIRATVERYRGNPALAAWQVENEPFLKFGLCATRPRHALEQEISLVKSLDSARPIIVTDGGELGLWNAAIRAGDIFGTTMYRRIYPPSIGRYVGVIDYPLSPSFFRFRQKLARLLTGEYEKPFIVIELQSEPWGSVEVPFISYEEQTAIFPPDYFRETIQFAKDTGFDEYYLWGSEWWYYVREKEGDARYWDIVKDLLEDGGH
jgi:drug/metabolite transporter (DMT)-like permease